MREVWTRHTDIPQKTPLVTPRPKCDLGTSLTHNQVALVLAGRLSSDTVPLRDGHVLPLLPPSRWPGPGR